MRRQWLGRQVRANASTAARISFRAASAVVALTAPDTLVWSTTGADGCMAPVHGVAPAGFGKFLNRTGDQANLLHADLQWYRRYGLELVTIAISSTLPPAGPIAMLSPSVLNFTGSTVFGQSRVGDNHPIRRSLQVRYSYWAASPTKSLVMTHERRSRLVSAGFHPGNGGGGVYRCAGPGRDLRSGRHLRDVHAGCEPDGRSVIAVGAALLKWGEAGR